MKLLALGILILGTIVCLLRTARSIGPERTVGRESADGSANVKQPPTRLMRQPEGNQPEATASGGSAADSPKSFLERLIAENGELSEEARAQIGPWLVVNRTNAGSLLALRQAGGGREYLLTALTNYPNDPRVLFMALELDDSAEAQRARLDRFQAAAPDNALADYLSARDHLKHSRTAEAIRDLAAASQKGHFQDYMLDAIQHCEEFHLASGKSPTEAKALACSTALLPHLAQLKGLTIDLVSLEKQYLAAGDTASAENLALYALQLSDHLSSGEGSHTLIGQLVGTAVAQIALNPLAQRASSQALGGTVRERLTALATRKAAARRDAQAVDEWLNTASELDLLNYFERLKIQGESAATAWVKQRQP